MIDNLSGLQLLMAALAREGRTPAVIDRAWFDANVAAGMQSDLDGIDVIVVENNTWHAWVKLVGIDDVARLFPETLAI